MIYIDKDSDQTVCVCDRCALTVATSRANGVVAEGWMTGNLWLDISLTEQRQTPLCFCPDCAPVIRAAEVIQMSAGPGGIAQPAPAVDPEAARMKMSLTRPQLLIGLVSKGWLSEEEGDLWLAGTLPAEIKVVIDTLPADQQFAVRARAMTATVFPRLDPLVQALAEVRGKSPEEMDTFFTTWAQA